MAQKVKTQAQHDKIMAKMRSTQVAGLPPWASHARKPKRGFFDGTRRK